MSVTLPPSLHALVVFLAWVRGGGEFSRRSGNFLSTSSSARLDSSDVNVEVQMLLVESHEEGGRRGGLDELYVPDVELNFLLKSSLESKKTLMHLQDKN